MNEIRIHIPTLSDEQSVEVEVRFDGQRQQLNYRVETFDWRVWGDGMSKVECIRAFLLDYDPAWELVQIGSPSERHISVMFRQHAPEAQPSNGAASAI